MKTVIGIKNGLVMSLTVWLLVAWLLTGCSVKFELGWHGETGRDDRTQSELKKKEKY